MTNDKEKKKALEIISKFYIKIMTIFSVITSVMDPQYVYEDEDGTRKYFQLKDFDSYKMINKNSKNLQLHQLYNPMGLVNKRLTILKNKINLGESNSENIVMNPGEKLCEISKQQNPGSLMNEIGMKELDLLYYDVFDYETGTWSKRSEKMEKKYAKDVKKFYHIFTGKSEIDDNKVKSFADIELLQFHKLHRCRNNDFYQDIVVNKSDALFVKYMKKIDNIEEKVMVYKKKLIEILKKIFVVMQKGESSSIIISPEITLKEVLKLQEQTQDCILNIYKSCESNFLEALLIYEDIYDRKYGVLNTERISNLQRNNNVDNRNRSSNTLNTNLMNNFEQINTALPTAAQSTVPFSYNSIESQIPQQPNAQPIAPSVAPEPEVLNTMSSGLPKINNSIPLSNNSFPMMKNTIPNTIQQTPAPITPNVFKPSLPMNSQPQYLQESDRSLYQSNALNGPNSPVVPLNAVQVPPSTTVNPELSTMPSISVNSESASVPINSETVSVSNSGPVLDSTQPTETPGITPQESVMPPSEPEEVPAPQQQDVEAETEEKKNDRGIFSFLNFSSSKKEEKKDDSETQNSLQQPESQSLDNSSDIDQQVNQSSSGVVDESSPNNPIIANTMYPDEMNKLNATSTTIEDERETNKREMMQAVNSPNSPDPVQLNSPVPTNTPINAPSNSINIRETPVETPVVQPTQQPKQQQYAPQFAPEPQPVRQDGGKMREQMKRDIINILG